MWRRATSLLHSVLNQTARLLWLCQWPLIASRAICVTVAESISGVLLVLGWKIRATALFTEILLIILALTMTMALGAEAHELFRLFGCWRRIPLGS